MNENNPPMMLPNYYIYSEKALKAQAAENNGYVICAKTKKKFRFEKCRKVYIS
jgi:macrophage erythroblast attacher